MAFIFIISALFQYHIASFAQELQNCLLLLRTSRAVGPLRYRAVLSAWRRIPRCLIFDKLQFLAVEQNASKFLLSMVEGVFFAVYKCSALLPVILNVLLVQRSTSACRTLAPLAEWNYTSKLLVWRLCSFGNHALWFGLFRLVDKRIADLYLGCDRS